jgi:tetratricopeptide (TPR) repeat protein
MKNIIYTIAVLTTFLSYGQKKELKQAEKLIDQEFYSEALSILNDNSDFILNADKKFHAQFYSLKGAALKGESRFMESVSSLRKSIELDSRKYSEKNTLMVQQIEADLVNSAVEDNKVDEFSSAALKLYNAYQINPEKEDNKNYLYFAAGSAVNGKEFDDALNYYTILKDLGYTGVSTEYYVTPVDSDVEIKVSPTEYNLFKKSKDYKNQRTANTESRLPEIVKNIALIYVQKGEVDLAISAIKEARAVNPNDINLLLSEADLYIKLGDRDKFAELMKLAVEKDPNNAILYYNLGVINGEQGDFEAAKGYYLKALELDSTYSATYLNLVSLILEGESALVDQMNELVTSRKASDMDKYDQLEIQRIGLYKECLPYLEKLIEIDPANVEAITTAKNIYYTIDDINKFKLMNAKLQEIENQ